MTRFEKLFNQVVSKMFRIDLDYSELQYLITSIERLYINRPFPTVNFFYTSCIDTFPVEGTGLNLLPIKKNVSVNAYMLHIHLRALLRPLIV